MKTIQARRTRHAGHCWRSKDELVSDVLLWTPAYGQSKAGWPARTFIQQLCDNMGCNPEDLLEAMNDRETWRKRVWDIRASRTTWRWSLISIYITTNPLFPSRTITHIFIHIIRSSISPFYAFSFINFIFIIVIFFASQFKINLFPQSTQRKGF